MLDIKIIRENPEKIKELCEKRNKKIDIDKLLDLDKQKSKLLQEIEKIRAQKNKANREIMSAKEKSEKEKIISEMKEIDKTGDEMEKQLKETEKEFKNLIYKIPNILIDGVPEGKDESKNVVVRKNGEPTKFSFKPKDHVELGEKLGIIDIKRAAEISGARFNYLKGQAALLEFAIIQFTIEALTSPKIIKKIANSVEKGYNDKPFIPVVPPVMIRPGIFERMGRLSEEDKDERYYLAKDDLYLIGSAEHTLGPLHMDQILEEKDLPIRYLGFSTAFRREAGSYGKDTKGILRVHQFDKLEMESFATKENSLKEQEFFVAIQEYLVQSLKIPYQVVMICTGDMGAPDARQMDIECWIPSQNKYRETHTADLMTDFQARRLNTKVKRKSGVLEFVHMNDATAFAIGRILIAILENYQQKNGSVLIPKVLRKYLGNKTKIQ
ncbi:MAG: serine--tRNA ligase [bacterium]|nr:serine--tRNA ligase [bacterium]